MIESIHELTDGDATEVVAKLVRIKKLADDMAQDGSARAFEIYKMSRDALEIMAFDRISRDTLHKMGSGRPTFKGHLVSENVEDYIRDGKLINAIKEFRSESGLGLKEAKDWCEAYRDNAELG